MQQRLDEVNLKNEEITQLKESLQTWMSKGEGDAQKTSESMDWQIDELKRQLNEKDLEIVALNE